MTLPKVSFSRFAAPILVLTLVFILIIPHLVRADSPTGRSREQAAALVEPSDLSANSLEPAPVPVQVEAEPPSDMSPVTFLLLGSLGLGFVGGVSMMVLYMGPNK